MCLGGMAWSVGTPRAHSTIGGANSYVSDAVCVAMVGRN
eukprot:COSAG01_NODE_6256_length_3768_cov_2.852548_1_plen_39_part_00